MCYTCVKCGKCDRPVVEAGGKCPICGHVNSTNSFKCEECGFQFPLPPGVHTVEQLEKTGMASKAKA